MKTLIIAAITVSTVGTVATEASPQISSDIPRFYTVQFSSFSTKKRADVLTAKLKEKGIDAFETKMLFRGRAFYRVCAGSFATPDEARGNLKSYAATARHRHVLVQSIKASAVPPNDEAELEAMGFKPDH